MGGAEAVFHGPQQPVAGEAVALEGEHRIDQVLQHLGAGQHPLLGHMAHQQQGRVLALGDAGEGGGAFAHLGHRTRCTGQFAVVEGLDAVDDRHGRPQGFEFLQHQFQVGFGQQLQLAAVATEAAPAQFHLLGRFLGAHIQNRVAGGHRLGALQQQGRLADAGIAAHQHEGAGHQATAEHPVELAVAAAQALQGPFTDRVDRLRSARARRQIGGARRPVGRSCSGCSAGHRPAPAAVAGGHNLLHQAVPAAAGGAATEELAGLGPAGLADVEAGTSHEGV